MSPESYGRFLSGGIVLASLSARMIRFPILSLYRRDDSLELQLISGNNGSSRLIHVQVIDAVLGRPPQP